MPNVQQHDDDDGEIIRKQLGQFGSEVYGAKARERDDTLNAWDMYRVRVRDRARATSGSKPPGQQQEDYVLCDIVDQYEAVHSAIIFVSDLHPRVTEANLRTLFAQAGPIVDVYLPKDRATKRHQGCGFVEFQSRYDVDEAILELNWSVLFGKSIEVTRTIQVKKNSLDAGANLFVTYLNPAFDENKMDALLKEFGVCAKHIKIMKDPAGGSLGSGFFNFDSFVALKSAMEAIMWINWNYPFGRPTKIFYACMEGDIRTDWMPASSSNPNTQNSRPHTKFASEPPLPSFRQPNGAAHHPSPDGRAVCAREKHTKARVRNAR